jgi:hypothetical protein
VDAPSNGVNTKRHLQAAAHLRRCLNIEMLTDSQRPRARMQNLRRIGCPREVRGGCGVSEVMESFVTTLAAGPVAWA